MGGKAWTDEELSFLRDNYSHLSIEEMCGKINRTRNSIQMKANGIGLKSKRRSPIWSNDDVTFLKLKYHDLGTIAVATALCRTNACVVQKAKELGVKGKHGGHPRKAVTGKDTVNQYIRDWAGRIPVSEIAANLGMCKGSVYNTASRIGVKLRWCGTGVKGEGHIAWYGDGIKITWSEDEFRRLREIKEGDVVLREYGKTGPSFSASNWLKARTKHVDTVSRGEA